MRKLQQNHRGAMASCAVVFLSVSVFSSVALPAGAAVRIQYDRTIDLSQGKTGMLRPVSVTIDAVNGEVAITESRNSAVHILNASGIETFVTGRFADLSLPMDASVDAKGRLVCINKVSGWNNTISRLDIYGEPDTYAPQPPHEGWSPDHLIILRDGNYLTLEMDTGFLAKHDAATGRVIWISYVGDDTVRDNFFGRPCELPSGEILVPGGRLFQIFVHSSEGGKIDSFGRFGSAPGRMVFPVAIANGPDGTLLVLDRLRHKILVFDAGHAFLTEYGSLGSRPGQFYHPVSMAADGNGSIYVAQGYKGRVQVFNVLGDREN